MFKLRKYILSPTSIRILTIGLNFISNVLINRSLGLELKGQYTTILNYANFLQLFLNMGICYAYPLLRNEKGDKEAKNIIVTIIWMQTIVFFLFSFGAVLITPSITIIFILLLSSVMICNNQMLFIALIDDIRRRNLFLLSSTVLYIFLNVFAILLFPGKLYIIVVLTILKYIYEILIIAKSNCYFKLKPGEINKKNLVRVLRIGIPAAVLVILISCNYNIDIFMLNWMGAGDIQIGIYGVAYSLTNMLWILPDAFKELIYNKTAREDDNKFVLKCIAVNMIFCLCVCIGFFVLGRWFLRFVYGEQYVIAFSVTLTLFCGIIPMVAFKLIHPIYINKGRARAVTVLLAVAVIANIISSWFLIPHYGAFGAAIASVISYTICGGLFFFKYYHDFVKSPNSSKNMTGTARKE